MSVLIEDSPRNLAAWIVEAVNQGSAQGCVITPWATPKIGKPHRRSADDMAAMVRGEGGEVWFDAITHALQMGGVGDYRYYDEYDLWAGSRGDLSTAAHRTDHVRLVFEQQDALQATRLAPTVLLHHGETQTSLHALELATEAVDQDPKCWLSIAGTSPFWSSGDALDAHIGALAQLDPAGWFVTVARPLSSLPVQAPLEETFGLCRTIRALSEYAPVHVSHGDLAGLPGIAAGAYSVGTGWDQRQRVCSYPSFAARANNGDGGGWYKRPTFDGLYGSLKEGEAQLLNSADPALTATLGGLPAPGPREAYMAHTATLTTFVDQLLAASGYQARYVTLRDSYVAALTEWPAVSRLTSCELGGAEWVAPLAAGLNLYGAAEGW